VNSIRAKAALESQVKSLPGTRTLRESPCPRHEDYPKRRYEASAAIRWSGARAASTETKPAQNLYDTTYLPRGLDRVLEEHADGHRADAAGNWRDVGGDLGDGLEIDIANQSAPGL